jgi:hypothetical protein
MPPPRNTRLENAIRSVLGPRIIQDIPEVVRGVSGRSAAKQIKRVDEKQLENSLEAAKYGKRTFPTATAVGYATPMHMDAGAVIARSRKRRRQIAEPFFTDPVTGKVARGEGSKWEVVPTRLPGQTNPPQAFPAAVPEEYVSEGPHDQFIGEQHLRITSDKEAEKRHKAAGQRSAGQRGNFLSNLLYNIIK